MRRLSFLGDRQRADLTRLFLVASMRPGTASSRFQQQCPVTGWARPRCAEARRSVAGATGVGDAVERLGFRNAERVRRKWSSNLGKPAAERAGAADSSSQQSKQPPRRPRSRRCWPKPPSAPQKRAALLRPRQVPQRPAARGRGRQGR